MPSTTISPWGSLLTDVATKVFVGRNIKLGVILEGNQQDDAAIAANNMTIISTKEFNGAGWVRPSFLINGSTFGSYNSVTKKFEVDGEANSFLVTAPVGGFSIRQLFILLDGVTTPRDTNGIIVGVSTLPSAVVMAGGNTKSFKIPWKIRGLL